MTETLILYIIIGIISIFVVLSFAIGLERMIKIILGNYILGAICFAMGASIDSTIKMLDNSGFARFLSDGKSIIILIFYALFLFLIYHKSKININIPQDQIMQKSLYLIFVPLTVFSIFLTVQIIFLGTNLLDYASLVQIASGFSQNLYLQKFIINTPYWILIHGLVTVFVTSEFRSRFSSDI